MLGMVDAFPPRQGGTLDMKTIRHFTPFVALLITGGIAQAEPQDEPTVPTTPDETEPMDQDTDADTETDVDVNVTPTTPPPVVAPQQTPPQASPPPVIETNIYTPPQEPMMEEQTFMQRMGMAISVGGGVDGFTNEDLRDAAEVGGAWDVRVTLGTRSPIGFEASYIGSVQDIEALGLDDDALLVGNGLQGALRVNVLPNEMVQPFLYGGVAWRRYSLTNEDFNTSAVSDEDDVLEIPLGVG
ncbi:MAG: hypothetical protein H0T79_05955, partial [Deltaproteobacteria bacterium]|nr:hypothetical protein [Deltaproteobacteria bacterium]